jgi:hypothetical protein
LGGLSGGHGVGAGGGRAGRHRNILPRFRVSIREIYFIHRSVSMSCFRFHPSALAVLFFAPFLFQAQTISSGAPGLTMTSAIVGASSTQTARLNVLNLQPVIPGVTAIACPATLEFYDDAGALLKQLAVTNIAPATAANLVFKPAVPTSGTNARAQIRAVVFTPSPTVTPVASSGTTVMTPSLPACHFLSSLEIVEDTTGNGTGNTQIFTTDFRMQPPYAAQAVAAVRVR